MSFPPLAGHLPFYAVVAVVFLLMISVLVFAHEAGHYLFARLFNMGVEEFAIGFGKKPIVTYARRRYVLPLRAGEDPTLESQSGALGARVVQDALSRPGGLGLVAQRIGTMEGGERDHELFGPRLPEDETFYPRRQSEIVETATGRELHEETVFTIRPIPAGGFVRIKGMLPEEDGSETKIPGGFYSKPPWQRFIVLLAGPAFSVLAGILILVPVYMIDGISKPDQRPILGEVLPKTPAAKAKLREGDVVLSIQGEHVTTFSDVLRIVTHNPGVPLAFVCERGGKDFSVTVTPWIDPEPTPVLDSNMDQTPDKARQGRIGTKVRYETVYPGFGAAMVQAVKAPVITVVGIAQIFERPSRFQDSVSGPVAMVEITSVAVQDGVLRVFELMAALSISVGIFNLLPFPPLDGGQMAIAFAEMLRGGRRLSLQIQGLVSAVGMLAVFSLIVSAMYVDFRQITKPQPKAGMPQIVPVGPAPVAPAPTAAKAAAKAPVR